MASEADLYVVVSVAGESLGLRTRAVLKVIEVGALARLPRLPDPVLGVTPYRGRIITLVDLAAVLGRGSHKAATASQRAVLMDLGNRNVGLRVEGVETIAVMDHVEPRRQGGDDELVVSVALCGERTVGLIDEGRLAKKIAGLCDPARA
ncbi:MAG: chemotaxis protein CheW [Pseudomonadota bacterium]